MVDIKLNPSRHWVSVLWRRNRIGHRRSAPPKSQEQAANFGVNWNLMSKVKEELRSLGEGWKEYLILLSKCSNPSPEHLSTCREKLITWYDTDSPTMLLHKFLLHLFISFAALTKSCIESRPTCPAIHWSLSCTTHCLLYPLQTRSLPSPWIYNIP